MIRHWMGGGGNDYDHDPDAPLIPSDPRRRTLGEFLLDGFIAVAQRLLGVRE